MLRAPRGAVSDDASCVPLDGSTMLNASPLSVRSHRRYWRRRLSTWLEVLKVLGVTALCCGVALAMMIVLILRL
jgi:hypothetical protein